MIGEGDAGIRGQHPGDLYIFISVKEHEFFEREGNNILYEHFISFAEAALGINVEIPVIEGKVKIKVDPGTQSGKVLRLKGKGIPSVNGYESRGDLLITIHVWTPKTLSKEEKAIMEKLAQSPNFQPRPSGKEGNIFSRMKNIFE